MVQADEITARVRAEQGAEQRAGDATDDRANEKRRDWRGCGEFRGLPVNEFRNAW